MPACLLPKCFLSLKAQDILDLKRVISMSLAEECILYFLTN